MKVVAVHKGPRFWGAYHFQPDNIFYKDKNIEPVHHSTEKLTEEEIILLDEKYDSENVGALYVHGRRTFKYVVDNDVLEGVPIIHAAHVIPHKREDDQAWLEAAKSGRELYVMCGSVRSARTFNLPGFSNIRIVVAPLLGRSKKGSDKITMKPDFIQYPHQKWDIGFFSALSVKKRPHLVLEIADEVGKQLNRELDVCIIGGPRPTPYCDFLKELIEDHPFEYANVELIPAPPNHELFEYVQQSKVIFLPLLKAEETTCYAAWETVSYDIPLVGTDWAGVGEAIAHARHPLSETVPIQPVNAPEEIFGEAIRSMYPDEVEHVVVDMENRYTNFEFTIDRGKATEAIVHALTTETNHERSFHIPEQVHAETAANAFEDIVNGKLKPGNEEGEQQPIDDELVESTFEDVIKTNRGYSVLTDYYFNNKYTLQSSPYFPID